MPKEKSYKAITKQNRINMKIFFAGIPFGIGGPREVNKNLVEALGKRAIHLKCTNKLFHVFEMLYQMAICNVVVFSGVSTYDYIFARWSTITRKRVIYIMHGCNELENKINNSYNPKCEKSQLSLMKCAHKILCVSQVHAEIMRDYYPLFKPKIEYLTNGINWSYLISEINTDRVEERNEKKIVLMGGGRITKRNLNVCLAVEQINKEQNAGLSVDVYGNLRDNDESKAIAKINCVNFMGIYPHHELLKHLKSKRLFIQNSEFEPFSLGVVEALLCGCDLLLSRFVGAKEILDVEGNDVIDNPSNIDEIKKKILHVLQYSNNKRLLNSINRNSTSIETAADKLLEIIHSTFKK